MDGIRTGQGDIACYIVGAIINTANNDLVLGAGPAGAIAHGGGSAIHAECRRLGPIKVCEAAITAGGAPPAKYVIHLRGHDGPWRRNDDRGAGTVFGRR